MTTSDSPRTEVQEYRPPVDPHRRKTDPPLNGYTWISESLNREIKATEICDLSDDDINVFLFELDGVIANIQQQIERRQQECLENGSIINKDWLKRCHAKIRIARSFVKTCHRAADKKRKQAAADRKLNMQLERQRIALAIEKEKKDQTFVRYKAKQAYIANLYREAVTKVLSKLVPEMKDSEIYHFMSEVHSLVQADLDANNRDAQPSVNTEMNSLLKQIASIPE